ncbi:hypothetical protein DFH07DRAFT_978083 [Mycena maculata]|uniref:Uncharacterized protein n=1 Tax=Mycena maculata TaxID=230809 RepID=A0AAD7IJT0_9AGAR|nr:hypothetical protein DFH07DRAFT_978083 [Mycena maculata]
MRSRRDCSFFLPPPFMVFHDLIYVHYGPPTPIVGDGEQHPHFTVITIVSLPSYIYVSVYQQFAGTLFSSIACEKLFCLTVLQIPRTHVLFSLASFKITQQDIPTSEKYLHMMATLDPDSMALVHKMRQTQAALNAAVRELVLLMKENSTQVVDPMDACTRGY